jgi:hypothetical protein
MSHAVRKHTFVSEALPGSLKQLTISTQPLRRSTKINTSQLNALKHQAFVVSQTLGGVLNSSMRR